MASNPSYEIITTQDNSHTVLVKDTAITFHSTRGAIQESIHIFINAGLQYYCQTHKGCTKLKIFELGFGTGLNALLTGMQAPKLKVDIEFHAIELYPLAQDIFSRLNYAKILTEEDLYRTIMLTPWNQLVFVAPFFRLNKIQNAFESYNFNNQFDIIYFDAFAPEDQPELWTVAVFKKIFNALNPGGILVTYSSKTIVRNALQEAGFMVEKLEGPPGKREIIRAIKPSNS